MFTMLNVLSTGMSAPGAAADSHRGQSLSAAASATTSSSTPRATTKNFKTRFLLKAVGFCTLFSQKFGSSPVDAVVVPGSRPAGEIEWSVENTVSFPAERFFHIQKDLGLDVLGLKGEDPGEILCTKGQDAIDAVKKHLDHDNDESKGLVYVVSYGLGLCQNYLVARNDRAGDFAKFKEKLDALSTNDPWSAGAEFVWAVDAAVGNSVISGFNVDNIDTCYTIEQAIELLNDESYANNWHNKKESAGICVVFLKGDGHEHQWYVIARKDKLAELAKIKAKFGQKSEIQIQVGAVLEPPGEWTVENTLSCPRERLSQVARELGLESDVAVLEGDRQNKIYCRNGDEAIAEVKKHFGDDDDKSKGLVYVKSCRLNLSRPYLVARNDRAADFEKIKEKLRALSVVKRDKWCAAAEFVWSVTATVGSAMIDSNELSLDHSVSHCYTIDQAAEMLNEQEVLIENDYTGEYNKKTVAEGICVVFLEREQQCYVIARTDKTATLAEIRAKFEQKSEGPAQADRQSAASGPGTGPGSKASGSRSGSRLSAGPSDSQASEHSESETLTAGDEPNTDSDTVVVGSRSGFLSGTPESDSTNTSRDCFPVSLVVFTVGLCVIIGVGVGLIILRSQGLTDSDSETKGGVQGEGEPSVSRSEKGKSNGLTMRVESEN